MITDLLAAGVEEGTVRDDVGAGAVMMVLQGICAACDHPGSRTTPTAPSRSCWTACAASGPASAV